MAVLAAVVALVYFRRLLGLCIIIHLSGSPPDAVSFGEQFLRLNGQNAEILFFTARKLLLTGQLARGTLFRNRRTN